MAELLAAGGAAAAVCGDVRNDAGAGAVADGVDAEGGVDILVNNFGRAEGRGWLDGSSDDWTGMWQTNVLSAARMVRLLVPSMKQRGAGRVVLIGDHKQLPPKVESSSRFTAACRRRRRD